MHDDRSADIADGPTLALRRIRSEDLPRISQFSFTVSIQEPHSELARLRELHAVDGLWRGEAGAGAIVEKATARFIGTCQFYRSGPCLHGIEIGYIIHDSADRGQGFAAIALRLFSDYLFATRPDDFRHQLLIEVWNTASWKVAERCGFLREGVLRSSGLGAGDPADSFVYSRTRKDYAQELTSNNGAGSH